MEIYNGIVRDLIASSSRVDARLRQDRDFMVSVSYMECHIWRIRYTMV